jgi:hypothetical protein
MNPPPAPLSVKEIYQWIFETSMHVQHIEYFLQRLQVGRDDPQRPHDIIGPGNKFEWSVIQGLASQYLPNGDQRYLAQITASLKHHRQQYHHQQWNLNYASAPEDSLELGAIDAICSMLEDRPYQGGKHTYNEIPLIITKNPRLKFFTLDAMLKEMQKIKQPPLDRLLSLREFPNIGISAEFYDILIARIQQTAAQLKQEHNFDILNYDPYFQRTASSPAILGCSGKYKVIFPSVCSSIGGVAII